MRCREEAGGRREKGQKAGTQGQGRRAGRPGINVLGVGTLILGILAFPLMASAHPGDSSCVSCHANLDTGNARPAKLWEGDIHRQSGLQCTDCHGGDPMDLERAMGPGTRFVGAPGGMEGVRLCGGCHADSTRITNPVLPTSQLDQFLSGPHGKRVMAGDGGPTCVTCHGAHGVVPATDPSSPHLGTELARKCLGCHGKGEMARGSTAQSYLEGVHFNALEEGRNLNAPSCVDCHGAHRALTPGPVVSAGICGRCHSRELEYYRRGPHGLSLLATGQPACTDCHDHHRTKATGLEELVGRITDRCWSCHPAGSGPWERGLAIDQSLTQAMDLFEKLKQTSRELAMGGIQTSQIDRYNREAYSWLVQVESALHSVDTRWEELTGMAKVKMMASRNLARDHFLERSIRRVVFILLGLLSAGIFILLAVKLNHVEKARQRRHSPGIPEARQREQERHGR